MLRVYLVTKRMFLNQHFYAINLFSIYLFIYNNMCIMVLFNLRSKAPERIVNRQDIGAF